MILQRAKNAADVFAETDIKHSVDFVQHCVSNVFVRQHASLVQIHHAPWSSHDDRWTALKFLHLSGDRLAAINWHDLMTRKLGEFANFFRNLNRKLACWHQNQDRKRGVLGNHVQRRQGECSGFSRSSFSLSKAIFARKNDGNQVRLDAGWMNIATLSDGAKDWLRESQRGESLIRSENVLGPSSRFAGRSVLSCHEPLW